ncbi:RHS repeat-associated core domain-containing protein [Dysgonomonas sp. Marseille-P4677]|uniref:RHS repeat-associated core domain-containing protein n=1 Tax=Dysgonomonas sp. Marseille-P4677 TaxID=2364790 RepID=UPI00351BF03E
MTQRNHYYPFGTAFAEKYDDGKKYKYNGKKLDDIHHLNPYDCSARYYESAVERFTSVNPLAEKYYSWRPYSFVLELPFCAR